MRLKDALDQCHQENVERFRGLLGPAVRVPFFIQQWLGLSLHFSGAFSAAEPRPLWALEE